jgi:DNA-binding response OmpR family regulator
MITLTQNPGAMKNLYDQKYPFIFLADDDDDDVYFVRSAVEQLRSGIEMKRFINGAQLLSELNDSSKELPDFILLDLNMPVLDGKETLRKIRKTHGPEDLPVIILSTSKHEFEKELCLGYGANEYISKPYSFSLYLEILRKLKAEWIDHVPVMA